MNNRERDARVQREAGTAHYPYPYDGLPEFVKTADDREPVAGDFYRFIASYQRRGHMKRCYHLDVFLGPNGGTVPFCYKDAFDLRHTASGDRFYGCPSGCQHHISPRMGRLWGRVGAFVMLVYLSPHLFRSLPRRWQIRITLGFLLIVVLVSAVRLSWRPWLLDLIQAIAK